jgi:hypothetical protein
MSLVPFESLPDRARLWCFGMPRAPGADVRARLLDSMRDFVSGWTAHSSDLRAGVALLHDRFLLVAADESTAGASGCSIDALTGRLRSLGAQLDLELLDSTPVWFRDGSQRIRSVSRPEFTAMARRGEATATTPVFDLTLTRLGDVRAGRFETAASDTWHRNLLAPD